MPVFKVKAATQDGRVVLREVDALTRQELDSRLEREGLYPIDVKGGDAASFFSRAWLGSSPGSSSRREFYVFNKGFVALVKAGLPVVEALNVLKGRSVSTALGGAIGAVMEGVRSGKSLSEAMSARPEFFSPLYIAAVSSGERTGDLVPAISGYIDYQKRMEAIRKRVVAALTYPAVLTVASSVVIGILLMHVIPSFSKIYAGAGTQLPAASRMLIDASAFIREHVVFMAAAAASAVFALYTLIRTPSGRRFFDSAKLSFPQLGEIYHGYAIAKFSRTLSMVLRSGVHLVHALEMSKKVVGNSILEEKLEKVIAMARNGESVTVALASTGFMPEVSLRMFGVGEKSASLPDMLSDIAEFHTDEVDHKIEIMTSLIEPALMIIMGLIIGVIVVLIYMPIFQIGQVIR